MTDDRGKCGTRLALSWTTSAWLAVGHGELGQLFVRKPEEGSHAQDGRAHSSGVHLAETADKQLPWPERVDGVGVLGAGIEFFSSKQYEMRFSSGLAGEELAAWACTETRLFVALIYRWVVIESGSL